MEQAGRQREKKIKSGPAGVVPLGVFHVAAVLMICLFVFVVYLRALSVPFLYDDQLNIQENPYIRITELSANQLQRAAVQDRFQLRPLSNLSFGLDYYVHGLNLKWMHAENVLLHALCAVALYFLILTMLTSFGGARPASPLQDRAMALIAALIWAAHPAQVQAVTYLVQRQTELAVLGLLAGFLAYLKMRGEPRPARKYIFGGLAVLAFIIGAGSKEMGWLLPAYCLLFELTIAGRPGAAARNRKLIAGFALMIIICALIGLVVLQRTGLLGAYLSNYEKVGYGPMARLFTEARVVVSYVVTMILPTDNRLALDQEVLVSRGALAPFTTVPAALLMLAALIGALISIRPRPGLAFLGLGFFLALLPESTLIPVELQYDHRIYFYSLFVLPPLAVAVTRKLGARRALPLFLTAVFFLGAFTFSRNRVFQSTFELWRDAAKKSPGLARPWSNLCAAYLEREEYLRAMSACERAARLAPAEAMPHMNKAIALLTLGRNSEAFREFAIALGKDPRNAVAHFNYGLALEKAGRTGPALEEYEAAIRVDQFLLRARLQRARLLAGTGQTELALSELNLAVRLFPDQPPAWFLLGQTLRRAGQPAAAKEALAAALSLSPCSPPAQLELIRAFLELKDPAAARAALDQARQCGPLPPELQDLDRTIPVSNP